jgi:hypothetical protein
MRFFVDNEREILHTALITVRKTAEIERLRKSTVSEEASAAAQSEKQAEQLEECRMTKEHSQRDIFRATKAMDIAIRKRQRLSETLQRKQRNIQVMEHELFVNEEALDLYEQLDKLLGSFTGQYSREEIYLQPDLLLDEMQFLEEDDLNLIARCAEISELRDNMKNMIELQIELIDEESKNLIRNGKAVPLISYAPVSKQPKTQALETDMNQLLAVIRNYYFQCLQKEADVTALMMLEQLELELSAAYRAISTLPPKFVQEKQFMMEKARREERRAMKLAQKQLEQQAKAKAALERSITPAKRRIGRRLMQRGMLIADQQKAVVTTNQNEQITEELLFGPLEDFLCS